MLLPRPRGPVSGHVIESLLRESSSTTVVALGPDSVASDPDVQLALWVLYELHYRGFEDVAGDREWDTRLIELRRTIEARFERELREAVHPLLGNVEPEHDVADAILGIVAEADVPSPARFLQREASRENLRDYLRQRSLQQLKESDPQAFVVPRLSGAAKVALAELQYDEFGGGQPERLHQSLYAQALEAAGLDASYGAYVDEVSAVSLACTNVMSMFALNRRLRGASLGHFAAFEASSSVPSRKIAAGIERLGFPPAVAAYFHEHVEADAVHEQVATHDMCGALVAGEPELRDDVLFGAAVCVHLDDLSAARPAGALDRRRGRAPSGGGLVRAEGPDLRVRQVPGGPLLLRGAVCVVDDDGEEHEVKRPVVAVCACDKSARQPWCDSTHKSIPKSF